MTDTMKRFVVVDCLHFRVATLIAAFTAMALTLAGVEASANPAASVTVMWTAPGDDGYIGQAAEYDVRISRDSITETNWAQAMPVDNEPSPALAGDTQYMTITLPDSGTWYVAVKTRDEAFNWSRLSNVVPFTSTGVNDGAVMPETFLLEQNIPNPFNPTTDISFYLPRASSVRLDVYNIIGQAVRILVDGPHPAGWHRVNWDGRTADGRQVAAGVYLYQLRTDGGTLSKSMTLLK